MSRYLKTEDLTHNAIMDADKDLFYRAVKSIVWYPVEVDMFRLNLCAVNKMEGFTTLGLCAVNRMEGFTRASAVALNRMEGFTSINLVAFVTGLEEE